MFPAASRARKEDMKMKDASEVKTPTGGFLGDTEKVPIAIRKQFPQESEDLGAGGGRTRFGDSIRIGVTPGVNDESAKLVPGFVPTRYELRVLGKHYLDEALRIQHWWNDTSQIGSSERRMESFAWRRLDTIRKAIGDDAVDSAVTESREEWKKKFDELAALPRCQSCDSKYEPHLHDPTACAEENLVK